MSVKQIYHLNQEFQLSSVEQLNANSSNEFIWEGRTLTAWTDDNGEMVSLDDQNFKSSAVSANLYGSWVLNRLPVWLSSMTTEDPEDTTSGILSCIWNKDSDYRPLAEPESGSFTLSGLQVKSERYYGSSISVLLVPDSSHIPVRMQFFMQKDQNRWYDVTDVDSICDIGSLYSTTDPLSIVVEWKENLYIVELEDRIIMWIVNPVSKEFRTIELVDNHNRWVFSLMPYSSEFRTLELEENEIRQLMSFMPYRTEVKKVTLEDIMTKFSINQHSSNKDFKFMTLEDVPMRFILSQYKNNL